jgi:hypothetical protein
MSNQTSNVMSSRKQISLIAENSFLFANTPDVVYSIKIIVSADKKHIAFQVIKIKKKYSLLYKGGNAVNAFELNGDDVKAFVKKLGWCIYNHYFVIKELSKKQMMLDVHFENFNQNILLELVEESGNEDCNSNNNSMNNDNNNKLIETLKQTIQYQDQKINHLENKQKELYEKIASFEKTIVYLSNKLKDLDKNNNTSNNNNITQHISTSNDLNSLKQHINTLGNNVPNYNDTMMQSQRLFHKKISMDLPPQNAMEISQRPMRSFQRGATAENMDTMMMSSQPPSRVNKNMQFPSNKSQIIMNESEQNMLKQWINPNKKLTFDLIFSSLYSPLSISSFHQSCDKIRPTLILILTDNGYRIGGFVTKPWDIDPNSKSKKDEFSFIFSLDLCEKYTILNSNSSSALFYTQNSIVGFGNDLFINDQSKGFKSYCHHPTLYCPDHQGRSITNGKKEFNVKLMEVFAVKFS